MNDASQRLWWKRKRWIALGMLWLVLPAMYALSIGPVYYCVGRGWLRDDDETAIAFYLPLVSAVSVSGHQQQLVDYCSWWERHGALDAGSF